MTAFKFLCFESFSFIIFIIIIIVIIIIIIVVNTNVLYLAIPAIQLLVRCRRHRQFQHHQVCPLHQGN